MSQDNTSELSKLWSHEPHSYLRFRPGDKVSEIDAEATPGFTGSKSDAPALAAERGERFAGLQEMLYANSRSGDHRSVLLVLQGMDTGGVEPWAFHIVGGVQLATHSWMSNPRMSTDQLIDYLTMLSWSALRGIVEVGGSLEKFNSQAHPSPTLPTHLLD